MRIFRLKTLPELLQAAASESKPKYYLAGGTDLLVQKLDGALAEGTWFDISALQELHQLEKENHHIRIGSTVTYTEMIESALVKKYAPALWKACLAVGGPQIRNRGTIGGNLGNASPAGDTIPPLYSLEARVVLASVRGERKMPVHDFFTGPGQTALQQDEIILGVQFPVRANLKGLFLRLGQRQAQTISKVSIAVSAQTENHRFQYLRIALGAVAPTVIYARNAENILRKGEVTAEAIQSAKQAVIQEVQPISDIRSTAEYRRAMSGVLLEKAIEEILA